MVVVVVVVVVAIGWWRWWWYFGWLGGGIVPWLTDQHNHHCVDHTRHGSAQTHDDLLVLVLALALALVLALVLAKALVAVPVVTAAADVFACVFYLVERLDPLEQTEHTERTHEPQQLEWTGQCDINLQQPANQHDDEIEAVPSVEAPLIPFTLHQPEVPKPVGVHVCQDLN